MKHSLRLLVALTVLSFVPFAAAGDKPADTKKAEPACSCGERCKCTKDGKACTCKAHKDEKKSDDKKKPE